MVRVTVAVLTYRRNEDLRELLPMLLDQVVDSQGVEPGPWATGVLVVDNDPDGGAAEVVGAVPPLSPVRYVHEAQPGIAAARNRALDEAADDGLLVFIDDDERPTTGWLQALLSTWMRETPAAVAGPVRSSLPDDVDPWIVDGGYFDRAFQRRHRTGDRLGAAATNNLLLDMRAVHRHGLRFDPSLGLGGGEDTLFTRELADRGERIIWCAEALVIDRVPASRLTRRWVVEHVFLAASASVRMSLRLTRPGLPSVRGRARYAATGTARLLSGLAQAAAATLARRRRLQARGVARASRGAGTIAAVLGLRFEEYRR